MMQRRGITTERVVPAITEVIQCEAEPFDAIKPTGICGAG